MADEKNKEYCSPCTKLKEQNANFIQNGVTEEICESLMNNTGFKAENEHKDCEDLHDANDCLIKGTINKLPAYDSCDWKEYEEMFDKNQYNINEAIICALCGAWNKIELLESQVSSLLLSNLAVNTRYVVEFNTPEMSISIDRQGNFKYKQTDWVSNQKYGVLNLNGKVHFCMGVKEDNSVFYRITAVELKHYSYNKVMNYETAPKVTIRVPDSKGTVVFERTNNSSVETDINKKVDFLKEGTIGQGQATDWLTFVDVYDDWTEDDHVLFQIQFKNNNQASVPICADSNPTQKSSHES